MSVAVSSPGKLMLLGEHAVLFGYPCIVTAVGQRMNATVELVDEPLFILDAPDVHVNNYQKSIASLGAGDIPKGARFVERAVHNFLVGRKYRGGVRIATTSEFTADFGFGSSSASTVCVVGALQYLLDGRIDHWRVFDVAYKTVLDIQKKGSGYDIASACLGGTLLYQSGGKVMESIPLESIPLVIGYTGQKYETVKVIEEVEKLHARFPEKIDAAYRDMGALVPPAIDALKNADWSLVGQLMNRNQSLLEVLEISSPKLTAMIDAARDAGAWGAKLSGSGKGDCIIALAGSGQWEAVSKGIRGAGGTVVDVPCNVEGLRVES
jgi:mevalonate kinase